MLAAVMAGERADGDRRVGRPERSSCRSRRSLRPVSLGHQREAVDVGGLALVGRHAERGVALQMLDGAEALALGQLDVARGDVVLEVDEGLAARRRAPATAARPRVLSGSADGPFGTAADGSRRPRPRRRPPRAPVGEAGGQGEVAGRGARDRHAGRQARRARRPRARRPRPACRRDGWSGGRSGSSRPTPRAGRSRRGGPCRPVPRISTACTPWPPSASRTTQPLSRRAPAALGGGLQRGRGRRRADRRGPATATPASARSTAVRGRVVVVGEHHGAAAGRDGEAVEVGCAPRRPASRRAGRCRRTRAAARSRRPRARSAWRRCATARWRGCVRRRHRQMVGDPLDGAVGAAVIDAEHAWCGSGSRTSGRLASSASTRGDPVRAPARRRSLARSARRRPPRRKSSSARITRAPARPAASAAISPAGPPPITSTSQMAVALLVTVGIGHVRRRGRGRRRGGSAARRPSPRTTAGHMKVL